MNESINQSMFDQFTYLILSFLIICKYYRGLKTILHDDLRWLDVNERIEYKLGVMVYQCLHDRAPRYLAITLSQPLMLLLTVLVSDPLT